MPKNIHVLDAEVGPAQLLSQEPAGVRLPQGAPASGLVPGEVTVPLSSFVQPVHRHYFSGLSERCNYRNRHYSFPGIPEVMPLTRAFLNTCAADRSEDYRYLFTLLGSELANNAIRHTLSGRPGGSYTLQVRRSRKGLHLTCRDQGSLNGQDGHLSPNPSGLDLSAESGRGLAMVDAFATSWGDNGFAEYRSVWLYLAFSAEESRWWDDSASVRS